MKRIERPRWLTVTLHTPPTRQPRNTPAVFAYLREQHGSRVLTKAKFLMDPYTGEVEGLQGLLEKLTPLEKACFQAFLNQFKLWLDFTEETEE